MRDYGVKTRKVAESDGKQGSLRSYEIQFHRKKDYIKCEMKLCEEKNP
jgi:hypothetical protein